MVSRIKRLLAPPVFEDEQKARAVKLVSTMLFAGAVIVAAAMVLLVVIYGLPRTPIEWWTLGGGAFIVVVSLGLMWPARRGQVRLAAVALTGLVWAVTTFALYGYNGLLDVMVIGYCLAVIVAGLLLGGGAALAVVAVCVLSAVGLYFADVSGLVVFDRRGPEPFDLIILASALALTAVLVRYAAQMMNQALLRAWRGEQALEESNRQVEASRVSLQESLSALERRSAYLQASAEVGQAATSILDSNRLIAQAVELIRERFGLYYVGLFLVEAEAGQAGPAEASGTGPAETSGTGEWAVLRAGTGEAGQAMLARGHRIRLGEAPSGMIGWSIEHAQARVALDVGEDAVRLATAELPGTRSEAALPLRSRGRVLGALTVQSEEPAAFDQDSLAVLQTMTDQVAVALENARLFAESQSALEAARAAYGQVTREAWQELLRTQPEIGFRRDKQGLAPAGDTRHLEMAKAMRAGTTLSEQAGVAMPIKVRGQVIGVIDAHKPEAAGDWTPEEVEVMETLADQLGVALEGARLFREARRHAAHEEAVRRVTEEMRRGLDMEAILQTTVAELGRVLGVPRAYVRLGMGQNPSPEGDLRESKIENPRSEGSDD
jgi:GAF domain-containing protein